jgi:hypothetical protein
MAYLKVILWKIKSKIFKEDYKWEKIDATPETTFIYLKEK